MKLSAFERMTDVKNCLINIKGSKYYSNAAREVVRNHEKEIRERAIEMAKEDYKKAKKDIDKLIEEELK